MTTIAELLVADDPAAWRSIGFAVDAAGCCYVGTVRLRIDLAAGPRGVVAWSLADLPDPSITDIDGLRTTAGMPPVLHGRPGDHPVQAVAIDHVVVTSPDVVRTVGVIEERIGQPVKRWREAEAYGRPMRQAFFRLGEVILEVVGPPVPEVAGGAASFFGLAVTVADLEAAASLLGPALLSDPKAAVQPGRSIATVRSAAGLKTSVALMSPEPRP